MWREKVTLREWYPPTSPSVVAKVTRVTSTNPSSAGTSTILPDRQIGQDGVGMGWLIAFAIGDTSRLFMPPHSLARTHASDKKSVHISRANKSPPQERERERERTETTDKNQFGQDSQVQRPGWLARFARFRSLRPAKYWEGFLSLRGDRTPHSGASALLRRFPHFRDVKFEIWRFVGKS